MSALTEVLDLLGLQMLDTYLSVRTIISAFCSDCLSDL